MLMLWLAVVGAAPMAGAPVSDRSAGEQKATAEPTAVGFLYKSIVLDGEKYAYCVYVPPDYTPDKPWPAVLFLHGAGERGTDGFLQTDVGIGRAIRRHHERIPAIVVMPQCRPGLSWTGPMARMALLCLEQTSREYRIDPRRLYLTGLSLGGQGTWLIGAEYADYFAALVPICGFAELHESTGLAQKLASKLTKVPIWCFHGEADPRVPVERSRQLVELIRAAGGSIRYTEYPGAGHNVWDQAYEDPELWKWLFLQSKNAADSPSSP